MIEQREASSSLDAHCTMVARAIAEGKVVPFLGAGANLFGRPDEFKWTPGQPEHLPSGAELAAYLAETFGYPLKESCTTSCVCHLEPDLLNVSQYAAQMAGLGWLYDALHDVFALDYPPTAVHRFLAGLPRLLREKG